MWQVQSILMKRKIVHHVSGFGWIRWDIRNENFIINMHYCSYISLEQANVNNPRNWKILKFKVIDFEWMQSWEAADSWERICSIPEMFSFVWFQLFKFSKIWKLRKSSKRRWVHAALIHTQTHTYACTYRAHGNESANLISVCDDITPLHTQRERWRTALHRRSDNLCYEMIEHEIRSHTHQHTCTQTMCTVRKRVVWMCLCVAPVPTSQNQTKNHAFTSMLLGVYLCFSVLALSVLCVCKCSHFVSFNDFFLFYYD